MLHNTLKTFLKMRKDNGGKVRYNYAGYAAQAGTNVLGHIAINF